MQWEGLFRLALEASKFGFVISAGVNTRVEAPYPIPEAYRGIYNRSYAFRPLASGPRLAQRTPQTMTLPSHPHARRLTEAEEKQFEEQGFVKNLPLFGPESVGEIERRFFALRERLPDGVDIGRVNCWHKANRWVYDLCRTPALLDYVEDILGPDFFLWGAQFFCKFPGDGTVVPWHQDAQYWPLTPQKAVTVWIAIFRTDLENAAMQVVRGSHKLGDIAHRSIEGDRYVLHREIDPGTIDQGRVVTFDLEAGEMSLHDDGLVHGSGPNDSDRVRAGLALRFSASEVTCDLSVWPTFEAYPVRGNDRFRHNPVGKLPSEDGITTAMFPHSSEFT